MTFEDATKAVNNDINETNKEYQNLHILTLVVKAVAISSEQGFLKNF